MQKVRAFTFKTPSLNARAPKAASFFLPSLTQTLQYNAVTLSIQHLKAWNKKTFLPWLVLLILINIQAFRGENPLHAVPLFQHVFP
ncbi:hypothetical protein CER18_04275 [Bartonella tribocorum]|uniref:Uncharacterized protein n=1 Tax=Bartonella tribocorum TaxID=85701 RepID=A0A2M6USQ2_9HYPH|nr:hypothetical protein CER18_04275 [Bartonella tribocorum]